jgi:hypothetical protein
MHSIALTGGGFSSSRVDLPCSAVFAPKNGCRTIVQIMQLGRLLNLALCHLPIALAYNVKPRRTTAIDFTSSLFEFDGFLLKELGAQNQMGSILGVRHGRCIAQ